MAETIDSLQISINASANDAADGIEKLRSTLEALKSAVGRGAGLTSVGNGMNKINTALSGVAGKLGTFNAFIDSLRNLTLAGKEKISSGIANQLNAISGAAGTISPAHVSNIVGLSSALHSLSAVPKGNVNSLVNALGKAPAALSGLNGIQWTQAANDISKLITALRPLETMGKAQGFTGTVSALARIPKIVDMLDENQLRRFDDALKSVASSMERVSVASGGLNIAFRNMTGASRHANGLAKSISNVDARTRNWNIIGILRGASQFLVKTISMTNEYVEDMNLFTVAMGEYADSAREYANQVSEIMGIDPAAWMRNQGIFMTLADGFGVTSERAAVMSRNLTQLGYDLSSFFNISSEDAMQKLQSGISGELEPLRRLGFDLSDARLKSIAYSLGIDKATASMNQAEKAQLRYYAIMTQVTSAQGDMARTLSAPSNQIRVFQAQLTTAGRAIGSIFIPALNAILPIATAVMQAIRGVATAIASLFGYSLPEVSYTAGLDSVTEGANNAATGLGNAAGAAKKLKNYLMGFDELNVIPDQSSGGGGGSGGAGGGTLSGFDFELPEYDFLADAVESNVDRIYRKIEPFVEWIKENISTIAKLTIPIGAALLTWSVAKSFIPDLSLASKYLTGIKGTAALLSTMAITVGVSFALGEAFMESGDPADMIAQSLTDVLGTAIAAKVGNATLGNGAGWYTAAATMALTAGTSLKLAYDGVVDEGWNNKALWQDIKGVIESTLSGAAVGFKIGGPKGAGIGALIGFTVSVAAAIGLTLTGIDKNNINNRVQWGDTELTRDGIEETAASMFNIDVAPTISLIDATVTGKESAESKVRESVLSLEADLKPILLGVNVSPEALSALKSSADTLVADVTNMLAEQQQTIKVAMSIAPAQSHSGVDISGDILNSIGLANSTLNTAIQGMGSELGELLSKGMSDGFTAQEKLRIAELTESMGRISKAVATGQVTGEHTGQTKMLLSDLTKDSALGVFEEYIAMETELLDSLTAIEMEAFSSAEGQLAGLREYLTTLDPLLDPQKYQEVSAQITELEQALTEWDIPGSVEEAFQSATGPAKQMLQKWLQDTFGGVVTGNFEFGSTWAQNWLESMGGEIDTPEAVATLSSNFENMINTALHTALGEDNYNLAINLADQLKFKGWDILDTEIQTQLYNTFVEAAGADKVNEIFASLGYSIPGAIQDGVNEAGPIEVDIEANAKFSGNAGKTGLGIAAGNLASSVLTQVAAAQTQIYAVVSSSEAASKEVKSAWSGTSSFIQTDVIQPIESGFAALNWNALGRDAARGLRSGLMSIKIPNFSLSWSTKQKSFSMFGKEMTLQVPLPSIKFYAGGGFPSDGELFVANENGAQELVGRIGNRSAVANQDQIGDAIFQYMDEHDRESGMTEEGIATAMVSAMRAAGLGATYIDGRQLAQAINRESQRAGKPALDY